MIYSLRIQARTRSIAYLAPGQHSRWLTGPLSVRPNTQSTDREIQEEKVGMQTESLTHIFSQAENLIYKHTGVLLS